MSFRRVVFGVLGVGIFLLAYLATGNPDLAGALPGEALVSALGNDYLVLVVVAVLAAVITLFVTVSARNGARDHTTPPEAEQVTDVPLAGDIYDDLISNSPLWALTHREACDLAKQQLTATAVRVVQAERGCTQTTAKKQVARGTWTDDPFAARFLGSEAPPLEPEQWLTTAIRLETPTQRGARHAVTELVARAGGDGHAA
ncbi:DUF7269 family protein [Haladaptatus sp. CMSO5]|uniref:DUF7269 family protein n=1 Tax=Haladaptatus sp. CMSO5 TaxID=3120514 RepID=UPI002FCE0B0E